MKKIIQKIGRALQVVLLAPIKLPGKALNIIKYIALGIGVVETVLDDKEGKIEEKSSSPKQSELTTGKEVRNEIE